MATLNYEYLRRELVTSISNSIAFQSMKSSAFRSVNKAVEILKDEEVTISRDERVVDLLRQALDTIDEVNFESGSREEVRAILALAVDHFQPTPEQHLAKTR